MRTDTCSVENDIEVPISTPENVRMLRNESESLNSPASVEKMHWKISGPPEKSQQLKTHLLTLRNGAQAGMDALNIHKDAPSVGEERAFTNGKRTRPVGYVERAYGCPEAPS